jgi:hypothetical protein
MKADENQVNTVVVDDRGYRKQNGYFDDGGSGKLPSLEAKRPFPISSERRKERNDSIGETSENQPYWMMPSVEMKTNCTNVNK